MGGELALALENAVVLRASRAMNWATFHNARWRVGIEESSPPTGNYVIPMCQQSGGMYDVHWEG